MPRVRRVLFLIAIVSGCSIQLDSILLKPSADFRLRPADLNYTAEATVLTGANAAAVSTWYVKTSGTSKGCVVIIPGADANKGRYSLLLPIFVDKGWDVVLYDYPGFGDSPGTATFDGVMESTRAALDYAFRQHTVVVGFGVSMGTDVLARVAVDYPLAACIFESAGDLREIGSDLLAFQHAPAELGALADTVIAANASEDFDLRRWIQEVRMPKLFLHSPDDTLTPWEKLWEIFKLAPQPKHLVTTQGDHAEQVFVDPDLYRSLVNGWLDGALKLDPIGIQGYQQILDNELRASYADYGLTPPA
ncbi:MAG TPA: alpha/beta fold hydrolase [Phycisphaerae bacterium]|nr:alpha/beta fold hydrolase [Phycisphaerae bacterium]